MPTSHPKPTRPSRRTSQADIVYLKTLHVSPSLRTIIPQKLYHKLLMDLGSGRQSVRRDASRYIREVIEPMVIVRQALLARAAPEPIITTVAEDEL